MFRNKRFSGTEKCRLIYEYARCFNVKVNKKMALKSAFLRNHSEVCWKKATHKNIQIKEKLLIEKYEKEFLFIFL